MDKEKLDKINKLKNLILDSKKTMALTGAGISTNSGIPDFRSKGTGLWEKVDPMKYLTNKVLMKEPEKFYKQVYSRPRKKESERPKPNRGHEILAEMERKGFIDGIITQNVDHLHQDAGSDRVYEVHGNTRDGYCLECGQYISNDEIREKVEGGEIPPRCNYCGGTVRPAVVLFGDNLPGEFEYAKKEVENSDLLIVIGSSLAVSPINFVTRLARKLVIINKEDTMMDKIAEFTIKEDATVVLEELIKIL